VSLTDSSPEHDEHLQPPVRGGMALWTLFVGFALLMIGKIGRASCRERV